MGIESEMKSTSVEDEQYLNFGVGCFATKSFRYESIRSNERLCKRQKNVSIPRSLIIKMKTSGYTKK